MPATYHPNITVVGYADELMGVGHLVEDATSRHCCENAPALTQVGVSLRL